MKRCLKSLLVILLSMNALMAKAEACCFLPLLLDPCHWGCGLFHQNPYATRRLIDDWLGYGYLRGQQNGSLGHYPLQPWNCYAPMYPRLMPQTPPMMPWNSQPQMLNQNGCCGASPGLTPPMNPWQPMPQANGCNPFPCAPFGFQPQSCQPLAMPCPPMPCPPIACQPMPIPMQVPVTTYRPVVRDRGSYQMVWVPRPVTELVPQTSWQTRYSYPQQQGMDCAPAVPNMYNPPMPQNMPLPTPGPLQLPIQSGCGDTPCQGVSGGGGGGTAWNSAAMQGDLMGDHEMATVPGMNPVTGLIPVIPQTFHGRIPIVQTSYLNPTRQPPVNRYRSAIR